MKIIKKEKVEIPILKNVYVIKVTTMEGDADDYHDFELLFPAREFDTVFRQWVINMEVLAKQYKNGMGYGDGYNHLPFWEDIQHKWFHECDSGFCDKFNDYKTFYNDEDGIEHRITLEFDEEMKKEIIEG